MDETGEVLIFSDAAGNYYMLPREILAAARVPDGHQQEVARLCAEASSEVGGYGLGIAPTIIPNPLGGMNEMSEMTSLRLQMTMDRRSKFIETLSNIMKKMDGTSSTIVQNLK